MVVFLKEKTTMIKIGITGLIGSGKSVVAGIFETTGIPVYYADTQAKVLMNSNNEIISALVKYFGDEVYTNGEINKSFLSSRIFNDEPSRLFVNSIVHPTVVTHFLKWCSTQTVDIVAIESALLFEARINNILDFTIDVRCDIELLVKRISARDSLSIEEAKRRITIQDKNKTTSLPDFVIINDEKESLITQCLEVVKKIKSNGKTR